MADNQGNQGQTQGPSQPQRSRGNRGRRGGRGGRGRGRGSQSNSASQRPQQQEESQSSAPQSRAPSQTGRRRRGGNSGQRRGGRGSSSTVPTASGAPSTRRTFGGHLTTEAGENQADVVGTETASLSADAPEFVPGQAIPVRNRPAKKTRPVDRAKVAASKAADLGTRIHEDISSGNYECIICTEDVLRSSKVYSCPKCYTALHLKCVQAWYKPQIKKREEETGTASEFDGSWRCPGCNSMVQDVPSYHCWCGKEDNPKPASRSLPPHSCGQTCSKPRPTCPHPCPLQCHAGPCPPCESMGPTQSCFCGKHGIRKPCRETDYQNGWSCREPCGDLLPCGTHVCSKPCHAGLCGDCEILLDATCYCGRVEKKLPCYRQGEIQQSYNATTEAWFEASFACDHVCERKFDCGIHECSQTCHTQDELPGHCPFAVDVVSHCPCGKTPLEELMPQPRQSCEDPVPHCQKPCDKLLPCGHRCKAKCHEDECPSCDESIDVPCRCGRVTSKSVCHQGLIEHPMCLRVCQATLNCGRHKCGEHCCTGEKKAAERQAAQRKKKGPVPQFEPEHICIRTCGRLLKCGKHYCEQMCHRGPCASCPEAIFEEISCNCGKTVLQPPQPCGMRPPECRFQCPKAPSCGHPAVDHHCHLDDVECPKCPFLVDKTCVCGKETISYHPCHLQEAHCGKPCGKKLPCGHFCKKLCHREGECSGESSPSKTCGQVCAKPKLLCDHPCQSYCHGQNPCDETSPCQAKVTITCPCGQRKKEVKCQTSNANPSPSHPRLECDDECLRLERNRRLAEALNVDPTSDLTDHVPYSDTTLRLFRELGSWAEDKEREFRVFAQSKSEVRMRFAPMPSPKRQFLHVLAEDYRFESFSDDPEPHRHVVVTKPASFTSAPSKTIGQSIKIRDRQASEQASSRSTPAPKTPETDDAPPFNALLLTSPGFGLTIQDLHDCLDPIFATQSLHLQNIQFLPVTDEILLRVTAPYSVSLAASGLESTLATLRTQVAETLKAKELAGAVHLVTADQSDQVIRRERLTTRHDPAGWNAVAGRAVFKKEGSSSEEKTSGRRMLGLKKKTTTEKSGKTWGVLGGDAEC